MRADTKHFRDHLPALLNGSRYVASVTLWLKHGFSFVATSALIERQMLTARNNTSETVIDLDHIVGIVINMTPLGRDASKDTSIIQLLAKEKADEPA